MRFMNLKMFMMTLILFQQYDRSKLLITNALENIRINRHLYCLIILLSNFKGFIRYYMLINLLNKSVGYNIMVYVY